MDKISINIGGVITELDKTFVSEALEAGELKIESDNLVVYDKANFETFTKNISDQEYKKGKTAGEEMLVKSLKEQTGIDIEGKKPDVFISAFKSKILEEAKIEPSKKIQELEADKAKLQTNYQALEGEFNTFKTTITEKQTRAEKDNQILSFIPDSGLKVSKDIAILALKSKGFDVEKDESGDFIPFKNGQPVKDEKTLQPLSLNDIVPSMIKELGLMEVATGGNGGKDEPGGSGNKTSYDKFVEEMAQNKIDEGSLSFAEEMTKRQKAGTLKI